MQLFSFLIHSLFMSDITVYNYFVMFIVFNQEVFRFVFQFALKMGNPYFRTPHTSYQLCGFFLLALKSLALMAYYFFLFSSFLIQYKFRIFTVFFISANKNKIHICNNAETSIAAVFTFKLIA